MNFDVVPFHVNDRYRFTSLMREFVSMGFFFSNLVTKETRESGIIGFFMKKRG